MRKVKAISLIAVFVLALALFAGCGANVSTVMTVDENFSGTREITLTIDNDDMGKVTGGVEALQSVIDANLPADMTYTISNNGTVTENTVTAEDGTETVETVTTDPTETYIKFVVSFTSLDDYRAKVGRLIALDPETEIEPVVTYEKHETIFKKGMKFEENFRSFDLIKWYFNALVTADIITETDTSDWYELGSDEVILEGTSYNASNHYFEVDEQEISCLDNGEVVTTLLSDGTFKRVITLVADEDTVTQLDEKSGSLKDYMAALATDGITFSTEETEYSETKYIFTFTAATAEDVVTKTKKVLQTESNTFTVEVTAKEGAPGVATVAISESLDGSFYFNNDWALTSRYVLYSNAERVDGDAYSGEADNEFYYQPTTGTVKDFTCEWLVDYQKVELEVEAPSEEELDMTLTFTMDEAIPEAVRSIALSALETAAKDRFEFEKDGAVATLTLSGEVADVVSKVNAFVGSYVPVDEDAEDNEDEEAPVYCTIELKELGTASKFTNGVYGDLWIDLEPVLGEKSVTLLSKEGATETNIVSSHAADADGNLYTGSDVEISFTTVRVSFVMIALTVISGLLVLVGLFVGIRHIGDFKQLFVFKKKEKVMPVAPPPFVPAGGVAVPPYDPAAVPQYDPAAQPAAPVYEAPVTPVYEAPVMPVEAPAAETAPAAEQVEEEEIL